MFYTLLQIFKKTKFGETRKRLENCDHNITDYILKMNKLSTFLNLAGKQYLLKEDSELNTGIITKK